MYMSVLPPFYVYCVHADGGQKGHTPELGSQTVTSHRVVLGIRTWLECS